MAVSNSNYYKPDEALQELMLQEQILNALIETQTILQLLVFKGTITREEVSEMRNKVRNSPKYKLAIDDIERQKNGFQYAKDNPEEYLKALFNAKMNGDIK